MLECDGVKPGHQRVARGWGENLCPAVEYTILPSVDGKGYILSLILLTHLASMNTKRVIPTVISLLMIGIPLVADTNPPTTDRVITADFRQVQGPLNTMFKKCVGAGRANEGLRADWQRQLTYAHRECGFEYIRMHGLFCDDMGVYREGKDGQPEYNWQYIDELYDFLQSIGMKPFVELGFMPSAMASGSKTIFWWRGNVTKPKDFKKWGDFIRAFVTHLRERYGDAEVRTWYFEVWNEPNLHGFFARHAAGLFRPLRGHGKGDQGRFARLQGWRSGDGGLCVGAGVYPVLRDESCAGGFYFHAHLWRRQGFLDENGNAGTVFSPNKESIYGNVKRVRQQIAESALPNLELHFTEWSASYTPTDPIHDSYHSAAFILDKLKNAEPPRSPCLTGCSRTSSRKPARAGRRSMADSA